MISMSIRIVQIISRNQSLEYEEQELQKRLAKERDDLSVTKNTSRIIEIDLEQNAAKIKYCDDLSSLGFGYDELRRLKDALVEIAKDRDSGSSVGNATDIVKLIFQTNRGIPKFGL